MSARRRGLTLSNFEFAQRRVLAEREYMRRQAAEGELSEQDMVELTRLLSRREETT